MSATAVRTRPDGAPGRVETPSRPARRRAEAVLVAAALLAGGGCDTNVSLTGVPDIVPCGILNVFLAVLVGELNGASLPKSPTPTRAQTRVRARAFTFYCAPGTPRPNGSIQTVPVDLVPPFRVETTVGLCDPSFAPDQTAFFGARIAEGGGVNRWSVKCVNSGGLDVTAVFGAATTLRFPGAQRVELAWVHDGATVTAYARDPEVSLAWQEVGRDTPPNPVPTYLLELFAGDLQEGAMTSCYAVKFVENGQYAAGTAPRREAAREIAGATTPILHANRSLSGLDADPAVAAADLDAARSKVDSALSHLETKVAAAARTPEEKALAASRKLLLRTSKGLAKSAALLRRSGLRKLVSIRKQLAKAMKDLGSALDGALPADLREALGGKKLPDFIARK